MCTLFSPPAKWNGVCTRYSIISEHVHIELCAYWTCAVAEQSSATALSLAKSANRNVWDKALLIHQNVSVCVVLGVDSFAVHRNIWSGSQLLPRNASIRVNWGGASRLATTLSRPQRCKRSKRKKWKQEHTQTLLGLTCKNTFLEKLFRT